MSEITVGDDKAENAIDIFVFSNGEQNSPPRKYHLELTEFTMWKGTLRNLGYSQYGLDNTDIDIYTTDGRKVEGPSQLKHLTAYVAVIPPLDFIQAGYDNYLIKASRSWEKRLLKITNSIESSTKDSIKSMLPKPELNETFKGLHAHNQNKKEDIRRNASIKTKSTILKSEPAKIKKVQERNKVVKWPTEGKQIKKTIITPETTTLRTQILTPFKLSSTTKRSVIKTKDSLQKKPLIAKKIIPTYMKRNDILKACTDYKNGKLIENIVSTANVTSVKILENKAPKKVPSKNLLLQEEEKTSKNDISSNLGQTQSEGAISPSVNEEKLISNTNKTTENEISTIPETKCDEKSISIFNDNLENEVVSILDKDYRNTLKMSDKRTYSEMPILSSENKEAIHYIKPNLAAEKEQAVNSKSPQPSTVNSYRNCSPMQKPLNNFVTIVNDDKIFRLQLNLEIENCNFSVKNEIKDVSTLLSLNNNLREEKETQVNIYEHSNQINEQKYRSFSNDDVVKNVVRDEEKIIIIQCSCCNNVDPTYLLPSNIGSNQKSLERLAPETSSNIMEGVIRCECEQITVSNTEPEENHTTKLFHTFKIKNSVESINKLLIESKMELEKCSSVVDTGTSQLTTSQAPAIKNLQFFINRDTQTSWCNVVLQVVRDEAGRYSFHLPPLHIIKNMRSHDNIR